jgi:hypothetical protein
MMADDLEATQTYFSPQTQEELDEMLASMGNDRPVRTIGATLSPTLRDELGNPVPIDQSGKPIYFESNPNYDPNAKPSFANAKKNIAAAADSVSEFVSDPVGGIADFGRGVVDAGVDFVDRARTGNSTLGDVFGTLGTMMGFGPATSVATRGLSNTITDFSDPAMSRIFLTPKTPNLTPEQSANYVTALDLADQGANPLTIKQQTGWENLAGKEWVYEIDDSSSQTRATALETGATIDREFTVPGGSITGQERKGLLLAAQRDMINLKKQFKANEIDEQTYLDLAEARQRALDTELSSKSDDRVVSRSVPLAPTLKDRGRLDQVFYHPELSNYVDTSGYTATSGALKGRKDGVMGDHDPYAKHINVYTRQDPAQRLPTMLHEVQHLTDAASKSPGKGFNTDRSPRVRAAAQSIFDNKLRSFVQKKMQDTLDTMNVYTFGTEMDDIGLTNLLSNSLVYDKPSGSRILDKNLLKENMEVNGFTDTDLTFRYMEETNPQVLQSIEEYAAILGSRENTLSQMSDFKIYEMELGEVKARVAADRSKLTAEQRRNSLATEDIATTSKKIPVDLSAIFTPDEF